MVKLISQQNWRWISCVWLFATPWIAAPQVSLSITNSRSSLRLTSIESVMPSSHLILWRPLLLLPLIPPSVRVFSNESTLHMRWPKYWSCSFSISPSNEHPGLISFRMDWLDLGNLGVVLERRPQCAVSHEVRRRGQWASRGAPGKSGLHASGEGERVIAPEPW